MPSKTGHVVAKALGIKLKNDDPYREELETPGASMKSDHTFVEEPPLVLDYLSGLIPSGQQLYEYLLSLFPFLSWIGHYNLQWLIGDLVAGKHGRSARGRDLDLLTALQASPLAPSSSRKAWLTPSWLI